MSIKELIDDLLLEVSFYHPIPNLNDKEHVDTLLTICEQKGYTHLIPSIKEVFLGEAEPKKKDDEQSQAQKLGLVHLGRGYYGKKEGEPPTHKSEDGKIRVLKPGEAPGAEKEKSTAQPKPSAEKSPKDKEAKPAQPTAQTEPAGDEEDKKEAEDYHKAAIETPQAVMNDPKAPARVVAIARAQMTKTNVAARREKEDSDLEGRRKNPDGFDPIDASEVLQNFPDAKSDIFVGKSELSQKQGTEELEKFNTDIKRLADLVQDAKEKGDDTPDVNLCQVSIPGTNLYCDDNKGIPREQMPQFKGKPAQGSPAAEMETDRNGEVDTEPMFKQMMAEKGIKTLQTEVPADKLKATQSELVGAKVVSMYDALENNPDHPEITAPVYVSRDGYVVDGHHRWAAVVAYNAKHPLAQIPMRVNVIDSDIKDVIPMANKFAQEIGVSVKKASPVEPMSNQAPVKKTTEPKTTEPTKEKPKAVQQEPEEKGSESDKLNNAYGKGKTSDIKPKEQPKVKDKAGDTAKTDDGKILYSVGGGYYSDTPGGIPKYIRVESVVEKAINEDSTYWWGMLFNEAVTAKTKKGTIKVEPITSKPEQEKAAIDAKNAREAEKEKSEEETAVEEFDAEKIDKSKANDDYKKLTSSTDEKVQNKLKDNADTFSNELDKLPSDAPKKELKAAVASLFNGEELTPDQKELCKKWVRVVEPGASEPGLFKVYIATKEGNFKRSGKSPASKIEYGGSGLSKIIRDQFIVSGLSTIPTSVYGGKKTTPNRVFADKKTGKTKLMEPPAKVDRGSDGKLKSVSVHGYELKPVDENEKGISSEEKKKRQRTNRNLEEIAKAISTGKFKSIDMDEGVKPDTPEGRSVNIKSAISKMSNSLKELATKYGAENNPLVDEMANFAKRDPNDKPEEWFKDAQSIFSRLANDTNDPSLKEAWPNFAEMYNAVVEMHDNGKGTQNGAYVILPESTTLENVDLISIKVNDPKKRIVSVEGKSVKAGEGGAGNIGGAIKGTQFKNDAGGKFKKKLQSYFSLRDDAYKMRVETPDGSDAGKYHKQFMDEQNAVMKKLESDAINELGYDAKKFAKLKKAIKTPGTPENKAIESATKYVMELRKKKKMPIDKLAEEKIRARMEYYYIWGSTTHEIYNDNIDVQDFVNDSIRAQNKSLAKDKKVNRVSSDGMNVMAFKEFEFNIGFSENGKSANPGAGRFHNMTREEYDARHNESVNPSPLSKLPKSVKERVLTRLKEISKR